MSEEKVSPALREKEAEEHIYGLEYYALRTRCISINVMLDKDFSQRHSVGYTMTFVRRRQGKFIIYTHPYGEEYDRVKLESSKSLVELANEHFKHLLQSHQHQLKRLVLSGVKGYDFEIGSLSQLETIELYKEADTRQFLSKVQHPLRSLQHESVYPDEETILFDIEQTYQVEGWFYAAAINYDQMTRLSANTVETRITGWTPADIVKFVKAWENDEIQGNFGMCKWRIGRAPYDMQELCKLLGVELVEHESGMQAIGIKNKKDGRTAKFVRTNHILMMLMQTKKNQGL